MIGIVMILGLVVLVAVIRDGPRWVSVAELGMDTLMGLVLLVLLSREGVDRVGMEIAVGFFAAGVICFCFTFTVFSANMADKTTTITVVQPPDVVHHQHVHIHVGAPQVGAQTTSIVNTTDREQAGVFARWR